MIGKYQLELGAKQLTSGMASSDYATDGALATDSVRLNPFINPGVMNATLTDNILNGALGNFIASCEDSNTVGANRRYFIDDAANAANYYYTNGASITKVKTGTATGTTYVKGKTDFVSYNGFFYASAPTVLNKWDGAATLTEAYKTFGDGNAHHPLLIYQQLMWVGDGNTLSTLDSAGTYSTSVLTLDPKEKIVALGIDPATGYMMISVQTVYDVSDTLPSVKAVYLYDGISPKPARKILVDGLIMAFFNVEGIVYVGQDNTIGQWNGNGVTFLRKLENVSFVNTELPYKHNFSNLGRVLFVANRHFLLAYGEPIGGQRRAWFNFGTSFTSVGTDNDVITCVAPISSTQVTIANFATFASQYSFTIFNIATAGTSFGLNFSNIYFPRPIYVRRMRVMTTGIATTASTNMVIFIDNEKGGTVPISTANRTYQVPSGTVYVKDFDFGGMGAAAASQGIAPSVTSSNSAWGLVRVIIYYDIAE